MLHAVCYTKVEMVALGQRICPEVRPPAAPALSALPLPCPLPCRQQEYAHWYPEEVTFKPQLVTDPRMSSEFLHRSWQRVLGSEPGAPLTSANPGLVERLYASHDKVRPQGFGLACCTYMLLWLLICTAAEPLVQRSGPMRLMH